MVSNTEFKYDLGVVGLGYVGLPLAVESATSSLNVLGFDINSERVEMINNGHSPIEDQMKNYHNLFKTSIQLQIVKNYHIVEIL